MNDIQIWAQMFFDDGTVTRGIRIPAEWLDEQYAYALDEVAQRLLDDTHRQDGYLLLWGAGNMVFNHYPTSFSHRKALESDS